MLCFLHTCGFFFLSVKYVWLEGPSFAQNYIETSAPTSSCVIMPIVIDQLHVCVALNPKSYQMFF